jgi:hypothetical protein
MNENSIHAVGRSSFGVATDPNTTFFTKGVQARQLFLISFG